MVILELREYRETRVSLDRRAIQELRVGMEVLVGGVAIPRFFIF
jgi:hypothetical protein